MQHSTKPLVPHPGVYELYWEFAAKRQEAFYNRLAGKPGPWTDDPILQQYKFCNVFRATDRVSQYMIREVCYSTEPRSAADTVFQIVAFRNFSKIETWEKLKQMLGHAPTLQDLADDSFEKALTALKAEPEPIYTSAFILCATDAYGRGKKHLNHVELFKHMFLQENTADEIINAKSLESVFQILHRFPLYGDFMSYQTAIDLNYSDLVDFSENDFTKAGPGALRGIKKVFASIGDYTPEQVIQWMVDHQDEEFARLGYAFDGLFGRKIHAIDAQGLFCETDKYCRVRVPELASARKRIKAQFSPQPPSKNVELFFPPKWKIEL